jgi:hypothetical protein
MTTVFAAAALALTASVSEPSQPLKAVVASYLEIQTQLAADKFDGIKAPAAAIVTAAAPMGEGGAAIVASAKSVQQASDIKAARDAFGRLSEAVIAAAKAAGWEDVDGLKLAYCPMARASWLQKEDRVRNPYYGSSMLECGQLRDPKK